MTPPALAIEGLTKNYHGLRPLRVQRLTLAADETVAILGFDQPSAEAFVNLVTGATLPDTGTVHVFGLDTAAITDGDAWLKTLDRFGIVTERAVLLDQLTVIQNLAIPFTLEVEPPPDDVQQKAEAIAREVGLAEACWASAIGALDAGARARVRLGRALAANPTLLLLEHVSAGLPGASASALGADIRRISAARQIAVLAATADEAFARGVAARVLRLDAASGRLVERRRGWFG